jgi:hypothetical protein
MIRDEACFRPGKVMQISIQPKQNGAAVDDRNPVYTLVELRGFEPLAS